MIPMTDPHAKVTSHVYPNKGTTIDGNITMSLKGNNGFFVSELIPLIWRLNKLLQGKIMPRM